jgi:2-keto-4-pentenoate hydratase/2-oxohepta-3-ene-1,7-dioic acid hydratase in catechol pathway
MTLEDGDIIMTGTPKGVGEINIDDVFLGKIFSKGKLLVEHSWTVK